MNYRSREQVDLHVIDAIDEVAFANGGSDAVMLQEALNGTHIKIVAHVARDLSSFRKAIGNIVRYRDSYSYPRKAIPYVHISCHGTKDNLQLGDRERLSWNDLSDALLPLQKKTDYNVPLSLSSCWGYHGASLAYVVSPKYGKRRPYYSLVGPKKEEKIGALCDAFAAFYRQLLEDFGSLQSSIAAANACGAVKLDYTYGSCVIY